MIGLLDQQTVIANGALVPAEKARSQGLNLEKAARATLSSRILAAHDQSDCPEHLRIRFDALASHDITYVGIIQSARASGLKEFPLPYVLTNCHNSLCAVGGTINEDDHLFGLMAAKKFGGIFVPAHLAVIHQYIREMMTKCGGMILGSDSHTRYGALGVMGVGEGGPELVRQLLFQTWNVQRPETVAVWLEGEPEPGVGPQDIALALIGSVFSKGFAKNKVLEFSGPGISSLSMDMRNGIDIMTTETACLSSIWPTDDTVLEWLKLHGREKDFARLSLDEPALYAGVIKIDLSAVEPMIALPFHPGNVHTIREFNKNARDLLEEIDSEAGKLFGEAGKKLKLSAKITPDGVRADQGIIAGCAGGTFENISYAAAILGDWSKSDPAFTFSLYPASVPVASALIGNGSTEKLMSLGAVVKTAFCGPCFGAGDTPAHGALSLRHTTRNFPNREGSKPGEGQIAAVALMDSRSIAATAANGGIITPATDLDWDAPYLKVNLEYRFNPSTYKKRVYNGFGHPDPHQELVFGPNISDWPAFEPLPEHLILEIASVILDPVTTTDELIPSGETSSLRSNPQKLAEYTLARKDPQYVQRAKSIRQLEKKRLENPDAPEVLELINKIMAACSKQPVAGRLMSDGKPSGKEIGLGSAIFAIKPGDGSAREQAASCQKVLGGYANIAVEYATKRYLSNLVNWGIIPFIVPEKTGQALRAGDYLAIPHVRSCISDGNPMVLAALVHNNEAESGIWSEQISLGVQELTAEERRILLCGCLMNYHASQNR